MSSRFAQIALRWCASLSQVLPTSVLILLLCDPAWGQSGALTEVPAGAELSAPRLFRRCYAQLTGEVPARKSPLTQSVGRGEIDPIELCISVLYRTQTDDSTGEVELDVGSRSDLNDTQSLSVLKQLTPEQQRSLARAVFRQLHSVHQSWFKVDRLDSVYKGSTGHYQFQDALYDEAEPALSVDRVVFSESQLRFDQVLKGSQEIQAIRSQGAFDLGGMNLNSTLTLDVFSLLKGGASSYPFGVQRGELLGVQETPTSSQRRTADFPLYDPATNILQSNRKLATHLGGGILGSSSYLLLNLDRNIQSTADGGVILPRAFARTVLEDFLCKGTPPVRIEDAINSVRSQSNLAFRQNATCMACHASLDAFAGVVRNVEIIEHRKIKLASGSFANSGCERSDGRSLGTGPCGSFHVRVNEASQGAQDILGIDEDPKYRLRPADGKLYFRSYDGSLIQSVVKGLPSMAEAMANTPDLYTCAAKRYFQYFTGIGANLEEEGVFISGRPSMADRSYRDQVIQIGLGLKNDPQQSVKHIISQILRSPIYRSPAMREVEAVITPQEETL